MLPLAMQAQQSLPYSYGFEDNDLSIDGWTIVDGTTTSYNSTGISGDAAKNGSYGFMFYYNYYPPQYLISPELTGTENGVDVEFYYKNGSSWNETFQVGYSTTDADVNSFTWGEEFSAPSAWTSYSNYFPAGTKFVAVKYTASNQFKMYIDDFTFAIPSPCPKPAGLSESNVLATSATLTWDAINATSWTLEYSTSADFADAISVEVTGNPSKTIEDLTAQTKYYVRVKADCGTDGESDWCNAIDFTTPCATVIVTREETLHESFETYGDFGCWTPEIISGSYNWTNNSSYSAEGSYSAYLSSYADEAWLISPILDLTQMTTPQLTFYHRQYGYYYNDELELYYRTSPSEEWTLIESFTDAYSSFTQETFILPTPSATYQIAFVGLCDNNYGIYLDDVNIVEGPTCFPPTTVEVVTGSVNPYGATISWEGGETPAPENGWVLLVNGEEVPVTDNPHTFTTLTPGTTYTVRVKSVCSDIDTSEVSTASTSFATPPTCPAPTVPTVVDGSVTSHGALISWTPGGDETEWIINYNGNDTLVDENPFEFDNLTASTTYTVKVKAVCGEADSSAWSSTKSFTTLCDPVVVTDNIPFVEDFNSITSGIPQCWNNSEGTTTYSSYVWSYYSTGVTGHCVRFESYYNTSGNTNMLKTPVLDLTGVTDPKLSFNYKNPSGGDFSVFVSTDGGATYPTTLATDLTGASNWTDTTFVLDNLDTYNQVVVVFQGTSNSGSSYTGSCIYLDDVFVGGTPTCVAPDAVSVPDSTVTSTSAIVHWNDNNESDPANGWVILLNDEEVVADVNPFTLPSLTPATHYTLKVKANCGTDDESAWSEEVSFTTECAPVDTLNENFDSWDTGILPACWKKVGTTGTVAIATSTYGNSIPYTTPNNLKFSGTTNNNIVALPEIESYEGMRLTFYTKPEDRTNSSCGSFEVGYITNLESVESFQALQPAYNYNDADFANGYCKKTVYLSNVPANARLAFNHKASSSSWFWFVDDVVIDEAPACVEPTALNVDTVTATTVTLTWVNQNMERPDSWTVSYSNSDTTMEAVSNDTIITIEELTPETAYTAKVKANCGSDWSDVVNFTTTPTCLAPTDLTYSNLTATTVTLDWTTGDAAGQWILLLNNQEILVNDHPIIIDTLTEQTPYVAIIRAICSDEDTSYNSNTARFVTPCTAQTAENYSENFSGYTASSDISASNGVLPDCWNYIGTSGSYRPHVYNGDYAPNSSDNCLVMTSGSTYGGETNFAVMPAFDDLTGKMLTFATSMESASFGHLTVGYVTDLTAASFVKLDTIPNNYYYSDSYATHEVIITTVPAGARIAFKWEQTTSWYSCAIDDIAIVDMPRCVKPIALTVVDSTITATSAVISWTDQNLDTPENGWIININGEDTTVTENPFTFDNLTAATSYTIKVAAYCSETDTSNWSSETTFFTDCGVLSADDYREDFSGYTASEYELLEDEMPNCWLSLYEDDYGAPHLYNGDYAVTADDNCLFMIAGVYEDYDYYYYEYIEHYFGTSYVIMPEFDNLAGKQIGFAYITGGYGGRLTFGYFTDATVASTVVEMETVPSSTTATNYEIIVENVPAGARMAFEWAFESDDDLDFCSIDDITITDIPLCRRPAGVTVTDITTTSATIDWTDNDESTPENGWTISLNDVDTTVYAHPVTFDNLTSSTRYIVLVKANCTAEEESEWSFEKTFFTDCDVMSANDYSEDFSNYTASGYLIDEAGELPHCWDYLYEGEEEGAEPHVYNGSYYAVTSGNNCIIMTSGYYEDYYYYEYYDFGTSNYVIMPEFDNLSGKQINFTYTSYDGYGTLTFGYITDATNAATFVEMETLPSVTTAAEYEIVVENVPTGARMAFEWTNTSYYDYDVCAIDNITFTDLPTCRKPTDVRVTVTSGNSAIIDWTDNNETAPQSWTISLGEIDTTVTEHPFTFDNLTGSTHYTVQVKANCTDEDMSAWSAEESFATPCEGTIVVTYANPYEEGFENYGDFGCWTTQLVSGAYDWSHDSRSAVGSYCAYFYYYGDSSYLISPVFDLTQAPNAQLTFQHKQPQYSNDPATLLYVYYRANATEEWTQLADYITYYEEFELETLTLPNPSATYQIAFKAVGNNGYSVFLDDIHIFTEDSSCVAPTNVAVNNGVVTWTGYAGIYNVKITVDNEVIVDTTVNTESYTIEGLEEGTHAAVSVQAVCATDDFSDWSEPVEFDYTVGINSYRISANIYPNPTTGNVTVESNAINADITVFDMFGKQLMTSKVASERTELNFSTFAPGVYVVRIANATATTTVKVVKK